MHYKPRVGLYMFDMFCLSLLLLLLFIINYRGFSRKLHKLVSEHRYSFDKHHSTTNKKREKYEPKNWKKLNEREIKSLHPVQRSKFMVVR